MSNAFGITLDSASLRWAAAEAVSETVIAAIYLLPERSIDDIVAKLTPDELEQVIKIVGRSPRYYPPGALAALKDRRGTPEPSAARVSLDVAPSQPAARPDPAAPVNTEKPGTRPGTRGETARRRIIVEDLMKAGLSVRAISTGTEIPRSSVHRAIRAITRAEAKREAAVVEIINELLDKRLGR